ncbi:TetR/AcrR family transcriptional regulator C-terminal domain-containing protein [Mycolicibacterium litorale]|uniref:TetR family transcriptional regulator n=1 Tax=Mycolicibacterium litorale TaxID=758802 RepID=A0AAD1IIJ0_9MYCO|nr:TetR/AcrR family transcriptional regulator C-terminal domain-containing protein [Mycolicibacterium litorale]MCV7414277.1 TetR/AcrR family transcriptional regulator C-terminal domain-containing protein [Mycolicibacterium litorale]TDY02031.1 TetR family transcriptional regulator [Mycolicibacterium litorale]BBY15531.1 TetR family transcriptional regulator [Mycolicibacterium litorale]
MDTVDLLWRRERPLPLRRGRPPRFTADQVVAAAIAVADRLGLPFTLRDVAGALEAPVMTLYSYVSSREQLLELMADQCRADMEVTEPAGDWRARLTAVVADNLRLFDRHPWLAEIESERAVLGPGTLAKYERELGAVDALPLGDADKDAALTLVLDFARSCARALAHARREREDEAPRQWWEREGAKLAALGIDERYPLASRIGTAAGEASGAAHDADAALAFGLDVLLNGLAAIPPATAGADRSRRRSS